MRKMREDIRLQLQFSEVNVCTVLDSLKALEKMLTPVTVTV